MSDKKPTEPMSDARIEELRRRVGIGRGVMDLATLDRIAEIYRLRDENTALREALEAADLMHAMIPDPAIDQVLSAAMAQFREMRSKVGGQPT